MKFLGLLVVGALHLLASKLAASWLSEPGVVLAIEPMTMMALATMAAPAIGAAMGGGGGSTQQQVMETPEQNDARKKLLAFANSGKFGNFTAGEELKGLGYGDFTATNEENSGLSALQSLLRGGLPGQYAMGDQALAGFLNPDPAAIQAQFDPFKDQVMRQTADAEAATKRSAGFARNLYSTDTMRKLGDVHARGNETLSSQLANLTNQALDRKMQAIPLAYQSAESQQNAKMQQISASQQYGALTRQLNDASIKARDNELLRRRSEAKMPIDALSTVAGGTSQFGVPSVQNPSPYADLLGMAGKLGGQYLSGQMLKSQFGTPKTSAPALTVPGSPGMSDGWLKSEGWR